MPIKVMAGDDTLADRLCEYCGGEGKRIGDIMYQNTSDYATKYILIFNNKKIINICDECCSFKLIENKHEKIKCDLCQKYKHNIYVTEKDKFIGALRCQSCGIYTEKEICWKCSNLYLPSVLLSSTSIGKYFVVGVTNASAHPKMKFEKHLVDIYPEKYKDYKLIFSGRLVKVSPDKLEQSYLLEFDNVTFNGRKKWKTHRMIKWSVYIKSVLFVKIN
jgi:hypothetical protein